MAKITVASNYSLNMSDFDFSAIYYGSSYVQSGTLFRVNYGDGTVEEFRGTGFAYNAYGEPIAGTVTSYAAFYGGQRLFYVEGGSVAATKIVAAANTYSTSDDLGVITEVLKGNDSISGGNLADVLLAFDGNDIINGNGGNDILWGYAGNDTIIGGTGGDEVNGGTGVDTASYATSTRNVVASLANSAINSNDALGDKYISIENLTGTNYNDTLYGNAGANTLSGGVGNDVLVGGAGADALYGSSGTDTVSYATATIGVVANLTSVAANTNDAKGDVYSLVENLIGTNYTDKLYGNASSNALTGGSGNDVLGGYSGNDLLYGGAGRDLLTGGVGADRFVFKALSESAGASFDSIYDFMPSELDKIDLSAIDASTKLTGNQAFSFVGTAAFKGVAGELRYDKLASDTYIYADVNGDKVADLKIHLDDAVTLTKDYFVL
ncbi:Bifunctional hemolysin/adenylate cyclase [Ensifer psoraleae]|uniref:calcium-binding protein n=1 Tax=Sinorhizobium psoraleae TaxID=520838 RepID=UPI001FE7325A|nr:calcium-binding protein [Sinorhizobium psoraleae]NRP70623.1 Bifunctional hemolysin/adenylate cyclase [Sinorhizobium psoraleae]